MDQVFMIQNQLAIKVKCITASLKLKNCIKTHNCNYAV